MKKLMQDTRPIFLLAILFLLGCSEDKGQNPVKQIPVELGTHSLTEVNQNIDTLLARHRDLNGLVNFPVIKLDSLLSVTVDQIGTISYDSIKTSNDSIAFWTNAYNILVIDGVINRLGIKNADTDNFRLFKIEKFLIAGESITLDDLAGKFPGTMINDPRFHFGLNCASSSCPELLAQAYAGVSYDSLIKANTEQFLGDNLKNIITPGKISLSKVFFWHKDEFRAASGAGVKEYILPFVTDSGKKVLVTSLSESFFDSEANFFYDWTLNSQ